MEEFNYDDNQVINELAYDENEDGSLDNIVGYKRDAFGRITEVCLDFNGDNISDSLIRFEYDNNNKLAAKYIDKNHDGVIDAVEYYEYDNEGNRTTKYDDNADGKIDYIETTDDSGENIIVDVRDFKQKIKEALKDILLK